jgi:hypothetical protein
MTTLRRITGTGETSLKVRVGGHTGRNGGVIPLAKGTSDYGTCRESVRCCIRNSSDCRLGHVKPFRKTAAHVCELSTLSRLMKPGVPPALPGRQSNFENSGSIPPAVVLVLSKLIVERAPGCCSCFCFSPVAIRPLRGASNRKPPALPTALPEDPYSPVFSWRLAAALRSKTRNHNIKLIRM